VNSLGTQQIGSSEDDIIAILDGQQRLTSLYLGLCGSYAYKEAKKRWDNDSAFPARKLHLNLLKGFQRFRLCG